MEIQEIMVVPNQVGRDVGNLIRENAHTGSTVNLNTTVASVTNLVMGLIIAGKGMEILGGVTIRSVRGMNSPIRNLDLRKNGNEIFVAGVERLKLKICHF